MTDISILSRLIDGVQRNVDVSQNSLVVGSLKVGSSSPTELTKAILDNLLTLQNGSDVSASLHHHDGRYFTETELQSTGATSGADRIGTNNTPVNYSPAAATVQDHLEAIDTALNSAGNEKPDNVFRIVDNGDATKKIAFEAAGIATATTRTITMPDANVDLSQVLQAILQDGTRAMLANLSLGGNKITNVANGTNPNDAVNLSQLDAALAGLDFQPDVDAYVADGATQFPGTGLPAAATGQRYIIADTSALDVAWGTITGVGDNDIVEYNGSAWVVAYDVSVQGEGALVWDRAANYFQRWDGSSWQEFGGLAGITAGAGLQKSGNVLSLELDTNSGLEFDVPGDAGKLRVQPDGSTLERSASGLRVRALGITSNELDNLSVSTAKIQDAAVNNDKLADNAVSTGKVQDAAITADKLNSDVADQDSISGGAGSPLQVNWAPLAQRSMVAGEAFAADETFLVRLAKNGETAGRVYKADNDATSADDFYVIGWARSVAGAAAGDAIIVYMLGPIALGANDAAFSASDVGKPVFLDADGAFTLTAPSAANTAVVRVGMVENTTSVLATPAQVIGVN